VTVSRIFRTLGTPPVAIVALSADFDNLCVGTPVKKDFKFSKVGEPEKKKQAPKTSKTKPRQNNAQPVFTKLDIRVGKIIQVWEHENSDKLFCEKIDLGEELGVKEIGSGLRQHYSVEELSDKMCLVVCNLRPATLGGFKSNGMVLCGRSSDGSVVELVAPPEDSEIGERIFVEGLEGEACSAAAVKKKKVLPAVLKDLSTNSDNVACYKQLPLLTSKGQCVVPNVTNGKID